MACSAVNCSTYVCMSGRGPAGVITTTRPLPARVVSTGIGTRVNSLISSKAFSRLAALRLSENSTNIGVSGWAGLSSSAPRPGNVAVTVGASAVITEPSGGEVALTVPSPPGGPMGPPGPSGSSWQVPAKTHVELSQPARVSARAGRARDAMMAAAIGRRDACMRGAAGARGGVGGERTSSGRLPSRRVRIAPLPAFDGAPIVVDRPPGYTRGP